MKIFEDKSVPGRRSTNACGYCRNTGHNRSNCPHAPEDWAHFNINNRTTHDASISSGLALMACNKHIYSPVNKIELPAIDLGIEKYDNKGTTSKIIS